MSELGQDAFQLAFPVIVEQHLPEDCKLQVFKYCPRLMHPFLGSLKRSFSHRPTPYPSGQECGCSFMSLEVSDDVVMSTLGALALCSAETPQRSVGYRNFGSILRQKAMGPLLRSNCCPSRTLQLDNLSRGKAARATAHAQRNSALSRLSRAHWRFPSL